MKTMLHYTVKLLSTKGKIIFIHNLLSTKEMLHQLPALLKPYVMYKYLILVISHLFGLIWEDQFLNKVLKNF